MTFKLELLSFQWWQMGGLAQYNGIFQFIFPLSVLSLFSLRVIHTVKKLILFLLLGLEMFYILQYLIKHDY